MAVKRNIYRIISPPISVMMNKSLLNNFPRTSLLSPCCALKSAMRFNPLFMSLKQNQHRKEFKNDSHLLSDGRRESRASDDSFLLSGWVMLSIRSTHISITLPNNWSIWWAERRRKINKEDKKKGLVSKKKKSSSNLYRDHLNLPYIFG